MAESWLNNLITLAKTGSAGKSPVDNATELDYVFMDRGDGVGVLVMWDSTNKVKKMFRRVENNGRYTKTAPLQNNFLPDYKWV